jgi:NADPH:quinone reductase
MKAWLIDRMDGIGGLRVAEVADPQPARGEVVLKIAYAALNPADRYLAEGQYPAKPALPHILGRDGVGTIVAVGPEVSSVKPGDVQLILRGEVGVSKPGTFAEMVCVPVESLLPVPSAWSLDEAAGAALVYITAYQALTQWGEAKPSAVLITGASGGVGVACVQLAHALGHTVVALSRDEGKRARLRALGADLTVDPQAGLWRRQVKEFLGARRVDLAVDNVGGALFNDVIETLGYGGKISVVGRLAGPVPEFNTSSLLFRRLRIGGVAVGTYSNDESRGAWRHILTLLAQSGAKPLVDRVFAFNELPQAFTRLAAGPLGKVIVQVAPAAR